MPLISGETSTMESLIHGQSGLEDRVHNGELVKDSISAQEQFLQDQQRSFLLGLFEKSKHTPIHVSQVVLNGAEQIRDDVIQSYLAETIHKADTFEQLCKYSDWFHYKMVGNGMVESVSQSLDSRGSYPIQISQRDYGNLNFSSSGAETLSVVDVVPIMKLYPIKKFSAKTGTNIGNGEGDGYIQFQLRNMFRGGEKLTLDATKGTKTHSSYLLNYVQPLKSPWWINDTTIFQNARQLGHCEIFVKGLATSIKSGYFHDGAINHEFRWESLLRSCDVKSNFASTQLLFSAGDNVKHSLIHSIAGDNRDNHIAPSTGEMWKLVNELSLGKFWKTNFEYIFNKSWFKQDFVTLSSTVKAGHIHNFHGKKYPLHLMDKFYNGGSNDVRSFQLMGLGPKDFCDYVGGDTSLSYGVSVFSRLPFRKFYDSNFRLHLFFNGGRLINCNNANATDLINQMLSQHSLSTGFGLVFRHPVARFELNFTVPLTAHSSDATRKGFQYGIGVSFL
ncbi:unnamed protein product [Kluyveromyces dobzhanskii CBS 2104]|uniref:WGS project CCBQ000000000 data, contig 00017 n=1 Tax=Kluyveromyces dobzhanskii CBS 2104 TaxID=1427455 RepID=A0A0A8L8K6_9SACH|nr:unnamed protein product [Kluyveromyces dobzhanskii CBS 2104]